MAILYVSSEASELQAFANLLTGLRKLKWPIDYAYEGILEGRRILLAANGCGRRLAPRAVEVALRALMAAELSASRLEAVVSTGYCGALDPNLRESQIVVATQVIDLETNETFDCAPVITDREFASGVLVTQDRVAMNASEKRQLAARNAAAVDMESSAIAARARTANLPCACIKVVTDRAGESFQTDFNLLRTPEGRFARGKIGLHAVTHPKLIPELLRLRRRTRDASKALGDFLVSCRINTVPPNPPAG